VKYVPRPKSVVHMADGLCGYSPVRQFTTKR
jgi:hypothetical protein